MSGIIKAVFEKGVLRPRVDLNLAESAEVNLVILDPQDDPPAAALAIIAQYGGSFDFLADEREDIYSPDEGEEIGPDE